MKLHVTFETGHPAQLDDLDGAVAAIYQDQRPLKGLAERFDWRLNGFLSRLAMDEKFVGKPGDWLLVHTQGRLPYVHLFLVGMGKLSERSAAASRRTLKDVASKVALAGVHSVAIDLTELIPPELPAAAAVKAAGLARSRKQKKRPASEMENPTESAAEALAILQESPMLATRVALCL